MLSKLSFFNLPFEPPIIKGTCPMFTQRSGPSLYSHMGASMKRWHFSVQGRTELLDRKLQLHNSDEEMSRPA